MKIAIGSDRSTVLTKEIIKYLEEKNLQLVLCGALSGKEVDYVDASEETAKLVSSQECEFGVLFCNTGTGATIIANKLPNVRAALCIDAYSAMISKKANNANMIVLGIRLTGIPHAKEIVDKWLETVPSKDLPYTRFHEKTDKVEKLYRSNK
jgi:ribose 5-phosphate isomerase B